MGWVLLWGLWQTVHAATEVKAQGKAWEGLVGRIMMYAL